jgi:CRISPR/Cas system-associated endoribonuclease Cas2
MPDEMRRRREDSEFIRRGLDSIQRSVEAGTVVPAAVVIAKLRAKIDDARKKRASVKTTGRSGSQSGA